MTILSSHVTSILIPGAMKPLQNLRINVLIAFLLTLSIAPVDTARAQLSVLGQFNPSRAGALVSLDFDSSGNSVWVYQSFGNTLQRYTRTGTFVSEFARPGERADDADITFAPEQFTLGTTPVPAGSLLFVNGERGTADVYAVNKSTGRVIASLATAFGASHVVGITYHPVRNTLFLVADSLDARNPSTIAEINTRTGAVINRFGTGSADFTVFYGDIGVSRTNGHLFLVSSVETRIREFMPTGRVVRDVVLPTSVRSLSGIGFDDQRREAFLGSTIGIVWRVRGLTAVPAVVGGAVAGVDSANVICHNKTTGQDVVTQDGGHTWDCEAAGLIVNAGDIIQQTVIGTADTTSTSVGSSVAGVQTTKVVCQNKTTKQRVVTQDGAHTSDCEAAGLIVNAGDIIQQTVIGIVD
jgi:hypothetical protein